MRAYSTIAFKGVLAASLVFATLQIGFARDRGPRVEVFCPMRPIAVKVEEHRVLGYELHITNFDVVPLRLKRIEVFSDAEKSEPLQTLTGDALAAAMMEVGAKMATGGATDATKSTQTIEPGRRAVVFLWIELGPEAQLPANLRHRIVFEAGEPGRDAETASESTLENFPVPVSQEPPLILAPPFEGGVWLAGAGPANDSDHRRSLMAIDGRVYDAQRFAIDWMKVGPNGDSHHDGTARNENFWGYGEAIHAVEDGEVSDVMDGIPENTPRVLPKPVTLDNISGNYVTLRIAANRYVTYAHLQSGSIKVRLHEHVARGTVIARLGNTGQATAPHLHFQVTDGNSVLQSEGVPFVFASFADLGPGSAYELDKHSSMPRKDSIPGGDAVIDFGDGKK
jgi:murein DD-endopeptidase